MMYARTLNFAVVCVDVKIAPTIFFAVSPWYTLLELSCLPSDNVQHELQPFTVSLARVPEPLMKVKLLERHLCDEFVELAC